MVRWLKRLWLLTWNYVAKQQDDVTQLPSQEKKKEEVELLKEVTHKSIQKVFDDRIIKAYI